MAWSAPHLCLSAPSHSNNLYISATLEIKHTHTVNTKRNQQSLMRTYQLKRIGSLSTKNKHVGSKRHQGHPLHCCTGKSQQWTGWAWVHVVLQLENRLARAGGIWLSSNSDSAGSTLRPFSTCSICFPTATSPVKLFRSCSSCSLIVIIG